MLLKGDAAEATGVGITVEPEGGSEEPTTEPIALFDLTRPRHDPDRHPRRVAVVGSGVAGLTAAHVLGRRPR